MSLRRTTTLARLGVILVALALAATSPLAQEALPRPEPPFKGKIGRTTKESVPDFPQAIKAPKGAPNILLIMTDDVGFGATSPFGGPIPTPTFERLAREGLRYNQFHTTALCSPTRAALLSGRNHHSVATGVIMELGTGFPGYNSLMPKSAGTFAEILKQNGYSTSWYGKNHNVPSPRVRICWSSVLWDRPAFSADAASFSPYAISGLGFASSTYVPSAASRRKSIRAYPVSPRGPPGAATSGSSSEQAARGGAA